MVDGKLSDIAGLAVFPLAPYAATDLWRARRGLPPPPPATLLFWIIATGLVMAAINTFDLAADGYRWGLGADAAWEAHDRAEPSSGGEPARGSPRTRLGHARYPCKRRKSRQLVGRPFFLSAIAATLDGVR